MMNLLELSKATGLPPEDLRGILDELYTAIPKVKTVFEDLNAILLSKLLKRNIDLIKYSPE